MKKILLLAVIVVSLAVLSFADEKDVKGLEKDLCLLHSKNCAEKAISIQEKISRLKTEIEKGLYYGTEIKKVESDVMYVRDGQFTTCDLDHPHYYFGSPAMKIIIVTNDPGVEASYTPFLKNLLGSDITVEALKDKYIDPLSVAAKADLNAADLILVSRKTSSGKFVADIKFWNGLAAPVVLHSSFLIGADRWRWLPGSTQNVDVTRVGVVDGNDLVFDGVPITGGQVEISSTVLAGVDVSDQASVGNGTKIATPAGSDKVMIARWAAGTFRRR